mmetsp:Transcript_36157/g.75211  ORF Transcript_36157/g.75211 Transcript_36157/m.75211 type:complete len:114 (+) Transcript_36157:389-730(+)
MNKIPNALPASRILEKKVGNIVAETTVKTEVKGNADVPAGRSSLDRSPPAVTRTDETQAASANEGNEKEEEALSTLSGSDIVMPGSSLADNTSSVAALSPSSPGDEIENSIAK